MTQKQFISSEGKVISLQLNDPQVADALAKFHAEIRPLSVAWQQVARSAIHDKLFVDAALKAIKTIGPKITPGVMGYLKDGIRHYLSNDVDLYIPNVDTHKDDNPHDNNGSDKGGAVGSEAIAQRPISRGAEQAPIERKAKTPEIGTQNKPKTPRAEPPKASILSIKTRADDFDLVLLDDIEVGKEPACLIEGLLPLGPALHVSFGAPKTLKSLLLMHCFLHVAAGMDYCGRKVMQGAVVYVTNEGITGVRRRLVAMRQHLHLKGKRIPFYLVKTMPDMGTNETDAKLLIDKIKQSIPAGTSVRARPRKNPACAGLSILR